MLRKVLATLLVAVTLSILNPVPTVEARGGGHTGGAGNRPSAGFTVEQILDALDLTEAQRTTVDATVNELILASASREEIRAAIVTHLREFGVEVPPVLYSRLEQQLTAIEMTDEQREEINALIAELQEAGTSDDEIRDAVVTRLEELGVEVPIYLLGHIDRLLLNLGLTEEQIAEVKAEVTALRETDATKAEIRTAVTEKLEAMGVDVSMGLRVKRGNSQGFRYFLPDLTEEQRGEIQELVTEMRAAEATGHEVREAVKELLVEWGVIAEAAGDDAAADLAIIDGDIQAAPSAAPTVNRKITSWGAIKSGR